MKITAASHLDHGLTEAQIAFIQERFADRDSFFIETFELPEGTIPCGLHGPIMGDDPILEEEVVYEKRGNREYESRMVDRPTRPTSTVTVIAGPHEEEPCILYTAFGGPLAPREPDDWDITEAEEHRKSVRFWSRHALSR